MLLSNTKMLDCVNNRFKGNNRNKFPINRLQSYFSRVILAMQQGLLKMYNLHRVVEQMLLSANNWMVFMYDNVNHRFVAVNCLSMSRKQRATANALFKHEFVDVIWIRCLQIIASICRMQYIVPTAMDMYVCQKSNSFSISLYDLFGTQKTHKDRSEQVQKEIEDFSRVETRIKKCAESLMQTVGGMVSTSWIHGGGVDVNSETFDAIKSTVTPEFFLYWILDPNTWEALNLWNTHTGYIPFNLNQSYGDNVRNIKAALCLAQLMYEKFLIVSLQNRKLSSYQLWNTLANYYVYSIEEPAFIAASTSPAAVSSTGVVNAEESALSSIVENGTVMVDFCKAISTLQTVRTRVKFKSETNQKDKNSWIRSFFTKWDKERVLQEQKLETVSDYGWEKLQIDRTEKQQKKYNKMIDPIACLTQYFPAPNGSDRGVLIITTTRYGAYDKKTGELGVVGSVKKNEAFDQESFQLKDVLDSYKPSEEDKLKIPFWSTVSTDPNKSQEKKEKDDEDEKEKDDEEENDEDDIVPNITSGQNTNLTTEINIRKHTSTFRLHCHVASNWIKYAERKGQNSQRIKGILQQKGFHYPAILEIAWLSAEETCRNEDLSNWLSGSETSRKEKRGFASTPGLAKKFVLKLNQEERKKAGIQLEGRDEDIPKLSYVQNVFKDLMTINMRSVESKKNTTTPAIATRTGQKPSARKQFVTMDRHISTPKCFGSIAQTHGIHWLRSDTQTDLSHCPRDDTPRDLNNKKQNPNAAAAEQRKRETSLNIISNILSPLGSAQEATSLLLSLISQSTCVKEYTHHGMMLSSRAHMDARYVSHIYIHTRASK